MWLLGLPTPLNRKHLLDFLNFSKTLRTHPHISSPLPNFCNCSLLWLTVVSSKWLFTFDFIKSSLFICLFHRYSLITYWLVGEQGRRWALSTLKPHLSIEWFCCFLVFALALLKKIKPIHFSVIRVLWNEEYSPYSKMKSSICYTHFNELFVMSDKLKGT